MFFEDDESNINNNRKRTQIAFRMYENLILNNQINVIKDLVINTKIDEIDFRNHIVSINSKKNFE